MRMNCGPLLPVALTFLPKLVSKCYHQHCLWELGTLASVSSPNLLLRRTVLSFAASGYPMSEEVCAESDYLQPIMTTTASSKAQKLFFGPWFGKEFDCLTSFAASHETFFNFNISFIIKL